MVFLFIFEKSFSNREKKKVGKKKIKLSSALFRVHKAPINTKLNTNGVVCGECKQLNTAAPLTCVSRNGTRWHQVKRETRTSEEMRSIWNKFFMLIVVIIPSRSRLSLAAN